MYRTHTCGELSISDVGKEVRLSGWVQTIRKFGSITFIDLRDRYGITQLLLGENLNARLDEHPLGREFVLQVSGKVIERSNKNPHLETGQIEIEVGSFNVLNKSNVPPFTIQDDTDGGDDLRMKYMQLVGPQEITCTVTTSWILKRPFLSNQLLKGRGILLCLPG